LNPNNRKGENEKLDERILKQENEIYTVGVRSSQNTNKIPAANPSNTPVQCKTTLLGKALFFNDKPETPALEAVLVADDVDDGPTVACEILVTGTTTVADVLGVTDPPGSVETGTGEVVDVLTAVPVAIVRGGRPAVVPHVVSNVSMRLCAEAITLAEGSAETAQLMQTCRLVTTAVVQRQLAIEQVATVDSMGAQIEVHGPGVVCRGRNISNERRASTTK